MFSLRSISIKGALIALAVSAAYAQINPANQINWPTGAAGCVYAPGSNTCVANGSSSGVQYNAANTAYQFLTDSKGVVATANATAASAASCNGTVCTITDTQTYSANQWIQFNANSAWAPTCLNWQVAQVSATGLSGSSFQVAQPATCSGSVSGAGGSVQDASYFFPILAMNAPFFNGHGTLQWQTAYVSPGATTDTFITNYTALVHPYTEAVTGNPTYTFIMTGYNDVQACNSLATIEGWYQTLWADLHTDGNIVVQYGLPSGPLGASTCYPAELYPALDQWLQGQKCSPAVSATQCWDHFINTDTVMANFYTSQLFIASNQPHFNNAGNQLVAAATNNAMAAQGSGARYSQLAGVGTNWQSGYQHYWVGQSSGWCGWDLNNMGSGASGPNQENCYNIITSSGVTHQYYTGGNGGAVYMSIKDISGAPFSYPGAIEMFSGQGGIGFNTGTCATSSCLNPLGALTGAPTVVLSADQTFSNYLAVGQTQLGQVTGGMRMTNLILQGQSGTSPVCPNGTNNALTTSGCAVGAVSSVFGRTGAVTANSGDYTVGQVTGAAPLASPALTGTPLAPTATGGTSTTQVATTAFVQAAIAAASSGAGIVTYSGPSLTLTGTLFFPIGGGGLTNSTETNVDLDSPAAATIQNFSVQLSAAPGVGNSVVFTWRKNASDTVVTCTISGASATSCNDTTHSFTVVQGDLMAIKAVTTGTVVGTPTVVMGTQFGIAAAAGITALTGDVSASGTGSVAATLATVNSSPGTCGDATHVCQVTVNGKGLTTAQTAVAISGGGGGNYVNVTSGLTASGCTISGSAPYVCTVGSSTGTVSFSSIPGTYLALQIVVSGDGTAATSQDIALQFNADTGSNYDWAVIYSNGGSAGGGTNSSVTTLHLCDLPSTGSYSGGGTMFFPAYAGTTFYKNTTGVCSTSNTGTPQVLTYAGYWKNTGAITSISMVLTSGNFAAGTTFVVYGTN